MSGNEELNSSSFGYPFSCSLCIGEIVHVRSTGYLLRPELKAKPYVGMSPNVLLIGQDPTLINRQSETVLELDCQDSPLRRYIEKEILAPLGFTSEDVYATNAVKCTFPGATPAQWSKRMGVSIEGFLLPFFGRCKNYLTKELTSLNPTVILAFGQPTHRLLVSAYHWKMDLDMKEVFGQVFSVRNPVQALYVPTIHFNTRRYTFYQARWPSFIQTVKDHLLYES